MGSVCPASDSVTAVTPETNRRISKETNVNTSEEDESNAILCRNIDDDINRNSCDVPIAINKSNLNKRNMNMNRSNNNKLNYMTSAQQRQQSEKEKNELKKQKEKKKREDAAYNNDTDFDENDFEYILDDRLKKRYNGSKSLHISQSTDDDTNPWNMSQFKQNKLETYFINAHKYDFVASVKDISFGSMSFKHYYPWLFNVINNKYSAPFFVERLSLDFAKSQDFKDDEKFFELFRSTTQTKHETDKTMIQYLSRQCQKDGISWFLPDDIMNTITSYSFYPITSKLKYLRIMGYEFEINAKNLRLLFDETIPIYLPQLKEIDLPRMNASFAKDLCDIYCDFVDKYQNEESSESNENIENHPFGTDRKKVQFHFFGETEDYFKKQFKRLIDNEQFDVQIQRKYVKIHPQPKYVSVTISRIPPLPKQWKIYYNSDHIPYYYNTETGETSWRRPSM